MNIKAKQGKAHLIRLLHVAKTQLKMTDEDYRANLAHYGHGKTSSKDLSIAELETVLAAFNKLGFKVKPRKEPARLSPSTKAQSDERSVIRAIWIFMAEHGFIRNGSETALNSYIKRMTADKNGGVGIEECAWLQADDAAYVINTLKLWCKREMIAVLSKQGMQLSRSESYYSVLKTFEEAMAHGH